MKEIDKLKAGLEYCFDDEEVADLKNNAIKNTQIYNNIDRTDREAKREFLKGRILNGFKKDDHGNNTGIE